MYLKGPGWGLNYRIILLCTYIMELNKRILYDVKDFKDIMDIKDFKDIMDFKDIISPNIPTFQYICNPNIHLYAI